MSGIEVTGGAGGVAADTADMARTASVLHHVAGELERIGAQARGATLDGNLIASTVLSPVTAARAEASLLDAAVGAHGLLLRAVAVRGQALVLEARVTLLRLADSGRFAAVEARNRVGGYVIGRVALPFAAGGYLAHLGREVGRSLSGAVTGRVPWSELDDVLRADPGDAGAALGADLQGLLLAHPGATDVVTGGSPALADGLLGPFGPLLPDSYEGMLVLLRRAGEAAGALRDGPITLDPAARPSEPRTLEGIAGIVTSQTRLMEVAGGASDNGLSTLRVVRVPQPDGTTAYVLQVPGTQRWDPFDNRDPSDITSNLALMEGTDPALLQAMAQALRASGYRPGEQVMLTGHSQGGIAAAAFAADPDLAREFTVAAVVTAGSPVARMALPDSVAVLSLENSQDPVPRLDGRPNPDRPGWTTVTYDTADPALGYAFASPIEAHSTDVYRDSADLVDASDDPSLTTFLTDQAGFFGPGTSTDYDIHR